MLMSFIKTYVILVCSFYIYIKLLRITLTKKPFFSFLLYSLLFTPCIYFLREYAGPLHIFIIVVISSVFVKFTFKEKLTLAFNVSVISFGIAYLAFFLAASCISFIKVVIFRIVNDITIFDILAVSLLEMLFTFILFKTKRLKNGMPSLMKHGTNDMGMYLSISLMLAGSSLNMGQQFELVYIIPFVCALICSITVIFWWRSRLTRKYLEDVKAREMDVLQKTLLEKDEENGRLRQHNEELAIIIHKDNKLIPAMDLAVREHLLSAESDEYEKHIQKGHQLLEHLESISRERSGIVKSYETMNKQLPSTEVLSIDSLMAYMLQKAKSHQIEFDLSVSGSMKFLTEHIITESDCNTMLADLIDNAIIATKQREKKSILVSLGICDNFYRIDIFDSGSPFSAATIIDLGLKKTTTHMDDGGSGIGLMTAFQILKNYRASFELDTSLNNSLFTKKVSICFDDKGEFRLITNRDDDYEFLAERSDITLSKEIVMA